MKAHGIYLFSTSVLNNTAGYPVDDLDTVDIYDVLEFGF